MSSWLPERSVRIWNGINEMTILYPTYSGRALIPRNAKKLTYYCWANYVAGRKLCTYNKFTWKLCTQNIFMKYDRKGHRTYCTTSKEENDHLIKYYKVYHTHNLKWWKIVNHNLHECKPFNLKNYLLTHVLDFLSRFKKTSQKISQVCFLPPDSWLQIRYGHQG